MKLVPKTQKLI